MKYFPFAVLTIMFSFSANALEDGAFRNNQHSKEDPIMYESLKIHTSECKGSGGAVVKFNGADAMNFCVGNIERQSFKYKKCIGKEINQYPIKTCVGVKKTVEMLKTIEVVKNSTTGTITRLEKNIDDNKLTFEQQYELTETDEGNLNLVYSFKSYADGRSGVTEMLFEK